ncbi:MAG: MGDG synthase family glycosyltransferase [Solirubrobacteraceae bacterium]
MLRLLLERHVRWQLMYWPRAYSISYAVCVSWKPGRRVVMRVLHRSTRRRLCALIQAESPDLVVSTYPGVTAALGVMRERSQLDVPVCALVTDIAGLHFWAHAGVDLHLVCYHESLQEIAEITRGASAIAARPPLAPAHRHRRDRHDTRIALGLQPDVPLIVISGGGWGVGDLRGAISAALAVGRVQVIVVCGHNSHAHRRLTGIYAREQRVGIRGYTTAMAELLGAANILVHSTGGMTCLEAAAQGCPVIAYGFGYGHMRKNVAAMARFGLIAAARDRSELTRKLADTIASPVSPKPLVVERQSASSAILTQIGRGAAAHPPAGSPSEAALPASL